MKKLLFKLAAIAVAASAAAVLGGCSFLEELFGHEHSMEYVAAKQATCTQSGNVAYYRCTVCGENFADKYGNQLLDNVYTAPLGHDLHKVDAVASTCSQEGNIEYYLCSRCNEAFSDAEGENMLTDVAVGKIAHTVAEGEWEYNSYGHWQICTVCGEKANSASHTYDEQGVCTVCGYVKGEDDIAEGSQEDIISADLSIHFIELGNKYTGDCTLIKCGDTEVLIDAGSRQNSASTICQYISEYCTDGVLEYVIATHAHQDHIAGFVGNKSGSSYSGVLYQFDVGTIIQFALTDATTSIYSSYCEAVQYAQSKGTALYDAEQCIEEKDGAQTTYFLNEEQTVSMTILDNYYYRNSAAKTDGGENNYSVCMLLTQQTDSGENNYLFTGDLEEEGEEYLVELNELPKVKLFKGGHHGSYTASSDALLSVIQPEAVAVCCCCGTSEYTSNSANQFPAQAFIDRVAKYTDAIYCTTLILNYSAGEFTSMNGDIVFYYDRSAGETVGSLKLWCSNNTLKLKDTDWFKEYRTWPSY